MYCSLSSFAQSSVSPYSMFGTGTIDNGCHGANSGMAGLGIGLRDKNTLNSANPASLTALEPKTFVMDIAVSGSMSGFYGQGQREYTGTGNIDMVGMGFRIGNYVAASIGLTPFSMVEYKIGKSSFMEGKDEKYDTYFTGTGGLHKISLSFGFNIFRDLSVGISGSVIMGQITETEVSDYWTATNKSVCSITAYPDFGIQYHRSVGKYGTLTAGVKYVFPDRQRRFHNSLRNSASRYGPKHTCIHRRRNFILRKELYRRRRLCLQKMVCCGLGHRLHTVQGHGQDNRRVQLYAGQI